ncbi:hypothetical protein, partial [Paenarthrobacter sp. FR1]|uniref:hypothetical protein n=1 Tax=Paenarthrobacter sp. FR1 TaxID=3439548 RepID=UPI003DA20918
MGIIGIRQQRHLNELGHNQSPPQNKNANKTNNTAQRPGNHTTHQRSTITRPPPKPTTKSGPAAGRENILRNLLQLTPQLLQLL